MASRTLEPQGFQTWHRTTQQSPPLPAAALSLLRCPLPVQFASLPGCLIRLPAKQTAISLAHAPVRGEKTLSISRLIKWNDLGAQTSSPDEKINMEPLSHRK